MMRDLHQAMGIAQFRQGELKASGKCFEEAKAYKIERRSELSIMFKSKLKYCYNT